MALESVTYITDLVTTNPEEGDTVGAGNDHFWGVKTGLAGTFAGFTGAAIASTEAQIDAVAVPIYSSISGALQAALTTSWSTHTGMDTEHVTQGMTVSLAGGTITADTAGDYLIIGSIGAWATSSDATPRGFEFGISIDAGTPATSRRAKSSKQVVLTGNDAVYSTSVAITISLTAAQVVSLQWRGTDSWTWTSEFARLTMRRVG